MYIKKKDSMHRSEKKNHFQTDKFENYLPCFFLRDFHGHTSLK